MCVCVCVCVCVYNISSVQFSSAAQSCLTLCDPINCSTPRLPVHHQLPEFNQTHVHQVSDAIQPSLCRPLLLLSPIPPRIRVFSNESSLRIRWPKYWSFSFSIIPSKEPRADLLYNGLAGSPCSPKDSQESSPTPQFQRIRSSVLGLLYGPALTSVHDYWENHSFNYRDLCWKVMSPFFNMLFRLVIAFLPRSKHHYS